MTAGSPLVAIALAGMLFAACGGDVVATSGEPIGDAGAQVDSGSSEPFTGALEGPLQVVLQDGRLAFSWDADQFLFHCVKISQSKDGTIDDFVYLCPPTKGQSQVTLGPKPGVGGVDFAWVGVKGFKIGPAKWALYGGQSLDHTSMELVAEGKMRIGPRFSGPCAAKGAAVDGLVEWTDKAPVTMNMTFQVPAAVRSKVWFNTPEIIPDSVNATGSTQPGGTIAFSYDFDAPGLYTVEINNTGGGAIINCGVYVGADVPLVDVKAPQGGGLTSTPSAEKLAAMRKEMLDLINDVRKQVARSPLVLDDDLHEIAQYHSDNMASQGFFGHTDPAGMGPGDRAKKFGFKGPVGENISKSFSVVGAHTGLYWSAAHRGNMLSDKWGRVGLGFAKDGKGKAMLVTQNFSSTK